MILPCNQENCVEYAQGNVLPRFEFKGVFGTSIGFGVTVQG